MSLKPSIKLNLLASWIAHAVALVVGFLLMPYVLHTLEDRKYGMWIFINSVASYGGLLYLGFGGTIGRFVAESFARKDWMRLNQVVNVVLSAYVLLGSLALAIAGGLAWVAPLLSDWDGESLWEIRAVILVLGVNLALAMTGSVFGGILSGVQRLDVERGITLAADFLRLGLTLLLLRHDWGLLILATIFLIVTIAENIGYVIFAYRHVPELRVHPRFVQLAAIREYVGFSAWSCVGNVANQLMYATDTVVIGVILGAKAIVPYSIALRLCQFLRRPISQIGDVCMPKAGELHATAQSRKLQKLIERGLGVSLLLTMGAYIGAVYFGDDLISNWMGGGYEQSHRMLIVLLGAQVVALPVSMLRSVMFGMGHVKVPSLIYLGEALCNLLLSIVLAYSLGTMGVAIGTALPVIVIELLVVLPYFFRTLRIEPGELVRKALGPQVLPLIVLWVYSVSLSSVPGIAATWPRLIAITLGGVAALVGTAALQHVVQKRLEKMKSPMVVVGGQ
ncbi:MAG: oligosaccharide flippase family protein [Planctomycetales bacterium]|nr:oligosaccharide flippase family protein [Planctomycetales bacterium]